MTASGILTIVLGTQTPLESRWKRANRPMVDSGDAHDEKPWVIVARSIDPVRLRECGITLTGLHLDRR